MNEDSAPETLIWLTIHMGIYFGIPCFERDWICSFSCCVATIGFPHDEDYPCMPSGLNELPGTNVFSVFLSQALGWGCGNSRQNKDDKIIGSRKKASRPLFLHEKSLKGMEPVS